MTPDPRSTRKPGAYSVDRSYRRDVARDAALAAGEKIYIGSRCVHGHDGRRYTAWGCCVQCRQVAGKLAPARAAAQRKLEKRIMRSLGRYKDDESVPNPLLDDRLHW